MTTALHIFFLFKAFDLNKVNGTVFNLPLFKSTNQDESMACCHGDRGFFKRTRAKFCEEFRLNWV